RPFTGQRAVAPPWTGAIYGDGAAGRTIQAAVPGRASRRCRPARVDGVGAKPLQGEHMSRPRIAVCVVTFNSAPLIPELVASLPTGAEGTDWTLVFADNASADGTRAEVARHAPTATVVETGANLGYAGGINAAVRAAGPQDAYLILNADVRLMPGSLS